MKRRVARILATIMMAATFANAFSHSLATADDYVYVEDEVIEAPAEVQEAAEAPVQEEAPAPGTETPAAPAEEIPATPAEEIPAEDVPSIEETAPVEGEVLPAEAEVVLPEEVEISTEEVNEAEEITLTTYAGQTKITVSFMSDAFDGTVTLEADEITERSREYAQVEAAVEEAAAQNEDLSTEDFAAFDIRFIDEYGYEVEPAEGAQVAVSISTTGKETPAPEKVAEVIHINNDNQVEFMEADTSGKTADFTTESFSIYIVVGGNTRESRDGYTANASLYRKGSGGTARPIRGTNYVMFDTKDVTFTAGNGNGASYQVTGYDQIHGVYFHSGNNAFHKVSRFRIADGTTDNWRVYAQFDDGTEDVTYFDNRTGVSNVEHFAWLTEPLNANVISAKVYLKYDNFVPDNSEGNQLHGPIKVANFGPFGNNEPYFNVSIDLVQLEELGGKAVRNSSGYTYYSYLSSGLGDTAGNSALAQKFFYDYIMKAMPNVSAEEAKLGDRFGYRRNGQLNYVGYVLKLEDDGWHLDGMAVDAPSFLIELYDLANYGNKPFGTIPSLERRPYSQAKDKFEDYFRSHFKDVTSIVWTDANERYEGEITLGDGTVYSFKITTKDQYSGVDNNGIVTYNPITPGIFNLARFFVDFQKVATGSLKITKVLEGDLNDTIKNTEFTFRVLDASGKALRFTKTGDTTYQRAGQEGVENIRIKGAGSVTVTGLRAGEYTVVENSPSAPLNYKVTTTPANGAAVRVVANDQREAKITNKYTSDKISVPVEKRWIDTDDKDGLRPASVNVKLMNGSTQVASATLNAQNGWKHTFTGLAKVDANGNDIAYTVTEDPVPAGYTAAVTGNMTDGFVITNTHGVETISIPVEKVWDDKENEQGLRPQTVTVYLLHRLNDHRGWRRSGLSITLSASNGWKGSFDNLPMYANKLPIGYRIEEEKVDPYTVTYTPDVSQHNIEILGTDKVAAARGIQIKNTYVPDYLDIPVEKIWIDNNDSAGIRPKNVVVYLTNHGVDTDKSLTLNEGNDWKGRFEKLPAYVNGVEADYDVREVVSEPSYQSNVSGNAESGFTITNRYDPVNTSVTVTKVWKDNDDAEGFRKNASVKVYVRANGERVKDANGKDVFVTLTGDKTTATFENLPQMKEGKQVTYTVEEEMDAYTKQYYTGKAPRGNAVTGYYIDNEHTDTPVSIPVEKVWDDNNNSQGFRPGDIIVELYANGTTLVNDAVLSGAGNTWTHTFYTDYAGNPLLKYRDGAEINYTVKEIVDDATKARYTMGEPARVDANDITKGFTMKNELPVEHLEIIAQKVWEDGDNRDGFRPDVVTVRLYANGTEVKQAKLNAGNNWSVTWDDLAKYANGREIRYTLREDSVEKYSAKITPDAISAAGGTFTVTNSYTPENRDIWVLKTWNDENDKEGFRKDVTVELMERYEGETEAAWKPTGKTLTLTSENGYYDEFTGLPKIRDKKTIEYTVKEFALDGYEKAEITKVGNGDSYGFRLVNTRIITPVKVHVEKIWEDDGNSAGFRPPSITVRLMADKHDGQGFRQVAARALNAGNEWKYTFENLQQYANGQKITYKIDEVVIVDRYDSTVVPVSTAGVPGTTESDGSVSFAFKVTNRYEPETIDIDIEKIWKDDENKEGYRPEEGVEITLLANGDEVETDASGNPVENPVRLSDKDGLIAGFKNLPKFAGGRLISYTAVETNVPEHYSVTYDRETKKDAEGNDVVKKLIVTNEHTTKDTSITVLKRWIDDSDKEGFRTDSVTVSLKGKDAEGNVLYSDIMTLKENEGFTGTFEGVPTVKNGKTLTYTVEEENVPEGYTVRYQGQGTAYVVVENTHIVTPFNIPVEKIWEDKDENGVENADGRRPATVEVQLFKASDLVNPVDTITVTKDEKDGKYKGMFYNVQKYEDGKPIVYEVREVQPDGTNIALYTATYEWKNAEKPEEGVTITNTYEPKPLRLAVEKVWEDAKMDLEKNPRPEEVVINLYAGSRKAEDSLGNEIAPLTLTAATDWKGVFENLPAEKNGVPIAYSIREEKVKNYQTEIKENEKIAITDAEGNVEELDGFVVTNTREPDDTPVKTANGSEKETTLLNRRDDINYTITTKIPKRDGLDEELATFQIYDEIDNVLEFKTVGTNKGNVRVTVAGNTLNNNLDIGNGTKVVAIEGQKLTVTIPQDYLAERYQGVAEVVVSFTANIKEEIPDEDLVRLLGISESGDFEVPNQGWVKIAPPGDDPTEIPTNIPKVKEKDPEITKKVDGGTHKTLNNRNDSFTYTIETVIPAKKDLTRFEITDELDKAIVFAGENGRGDVEVNIAGAAITADNESTPKKLTVSFEGEALNANKGKKVTIHFDAKLTEDEGFDFSSYEQGQDGPLVPNTAKYTNYVNGVKENEKESEKVTVTPPDSEIDKGIETPEGIVNEKELADRYGDIPYVISMRMPARKDANNRVVGFTIEDVLEPVLEVMGDIEVTVDGQTVTGVQSIEKGTKNNKETQVVKVHFAEGNAFLAEKYLGKPVTVRFTAKIKEGADLGSYISRVSGKPEVENDVSYKLDIPGSEPVWSDKVKVIPGDKEPEKEVNDAPKYTLQGLDEVVTYTIKTVVPERDNVQSFEIIDKLEPILEIVSTPANVNVVIRGEGGDIRVTGGTTIDYRNNELKINVSPRYITAANKGKDLIVTFEARIRDVMPDGSEVDLTDYLVDAETGETLDSPEIPNEATVRVVVPDDVITQTTPPAKIIPPNDRIEKTVEGGTHYNMQTREEAVSYTVSTKVPVRGNMAEFVITDELDEALAFNETEVTVAIAGQTVTDVPAQKIGKTLTVTFNKALAEKYRGKTVDVTFEAVIAEGADLTKEKYLANNNNRVEIPNEASYTIRLDNGHTEDGKTEVVTITPPDPEIVKEAEGEDANKNVKLTGRDEPVNYTITTQVPVHKDITGFRIEDTLEPVLRFKDGGMAKVTVGGTEMPQLLKIDEKTKLLTVTFGSEEAKANMGKKVVVTFTAEFEPDVDLSDYIQADGDTEVPNEAKYILTTPGNDPKEEFSTIPTITPGDPGIKKEVEGGTHYDLPQEEREKAFTYTIKTKMPERANLTKFEVTDKLEEVLEFATGSAGVDVTLDGQKIAGAAKIDQASKTLTVAFDSRYFAQKYLGKDIVITFTAKLGDNVTDEDLVDYLEPANNRVEVPNKASYVLRIGNGNDEEPKDSNEVTVTPPGPELDKETGDGKTYDTHYDMPDQTGDVYYRIKTAVPVHENITSFVVSDTLVDEMEFRSAAQEVEVTIDGTAVTGLASISGQTLTVYLDEQTAVANRGKEVVIVFKAGVKAGADVSKYYSVDTSRVDIPNKAKYVLTLPGKDPVEKWTEKDITITPGNPELVKSILRETRPNHRDLEERYEVFTYTLKTELPQRTDVTSFVIEDILEPELQYVATSDAEVRVIVGGTAVTGIAHIDKAKNTLTVNVPTDIIAANLGAEIRVENIRVQIRERDASGAAVSLARHINLANGKVEVPNIARLFINTVNGRRAIRRDTSPASDRTATAHIVIESNEVTVTPPDPKPEKTVAGGTHLDLVRPDQEIPYTITSRMPERQGLEYFVLTDTIEDVLQFVDGSVNATLGGQNVTNLVRISGQTLRLRLDKQYVAKEYQGQPVVINFSAQFKKGADLSKYVTVNYAVPNEATQEFKTPNDNPTETSDIVTVTPPPEIEKEVKGAPQATIENRREEIPYTINTSIPLHDGVTSFVVTDVVEPVLEIVNGSVKVTVDGQEVTGAASVQGQTLTVNITDAAVLAQKNAKVQISFTAKIREGADLSAYRVNNTDTVEIPNKASYRYAFDGKVAEDTTEDVIVRLDPEMISIPVEKIWEDDNNRDNVRPQSITVRVTSDAPGFTARTLTLAQANSWKGTFTDLPRYRITGEKITYTVTEDAVANYTTAVTTTEDTLGSVNGATITNTHTPGRTDVSVVKVWAGDAGVARPASITIRLQANGTATGQTLTLSAANGWSGSFTNLYINENGRAITYTVTEDTVANYTTTITANGTYAYTVTNTYNTPPAPPENPPGNPPEEPEVLGATRVRTTDTPEVLGARRGKTGDEFDPMQHMMYLLFAASACVLFALSDGKKKEEEQ